MQHNAQRVYQPHTQAGADHVHGLQDVGPPPHHGEGRPTRSKLAEHCSWWSDSHLSVLYILAVGLSHG